MDLCGYIDGVLLLALVPLQSVVSVYVFVPFHVFVFLDAIAPTPASGSVTVVCITDFRDSHHIFRACSHTSLLKT